MSVSRVIIVFLKLPVPWKVKSRLAKGLKGDNPGGQAVEIYRKLVSAVFRNLSNSDFDELRVAFDPPDSESESKIRAWIEPLCRSFPDGVDIVFEPQVNGDLGDRLQHAIHSALARTENSLVAAIGTDCVEIRPGTISRLWQHLSDADLAFGPTFDGGYYLVAAGKPVPEIFDGIPWSTGRVLSASIKKARAAGRIITLLEKHNDVDTIEDWEIARKQIGQNRPD